MTDDHYRAFPDECNEERDALAELLYESMEREKVLDEAFDRADARVRDLEEAQGELLDANDRLHRLLKTRCRALNDERRRNAALVMEIEAWRANGNARGLTVPRKLPEV